MSIKEVEAGRLLTPAALASELTRASQLPGRAPAVKRHTDGTDKVRAPLVILAHRM